MVAAALTSYGFVLSQPELSTRKDQSREDSGSRDLLNHLGRLTYLSSDGYFYFRVFF